MVHQYGNYTWELAGGQNVSNNHGHSSGFVQTMILTGDPCGGSAQTSDTTGNYSGRKAKGL